MPKSENGKSKRYTIATRDVGWEALIVTGVLVVIMVVWACLSQDQRLLFIPLSLLIICTVIFAGLLFRFITEPKVAIQADATGLYFLYRQHREIYFAYQDIIDVTNYCVYDRGGAVANCGIVVTTNNGQYKSISIRQSSAMTLTVIKGLLVAKDKIEYLQRQAIK